MHDVTLIFDIGRTNKKLFLFDNDCNIVHEDSKVLPEIADEDGFPCEDFNQLVIWVIMNWVELNNNNDFNIKAINFTSYGAAIVNETNFFTPATPLYSYMKPYPSELADELYERYGGKWNFASETASSPLGMLNSGMQLLWLKHRKPDLFTQMAFSMHLPQYLSFLFSNKRISEYTSLGCHTALWDFSKHKYHQWVIDEGFDKLLAPISLDPVAGKNLLGNNDTLIGSGLHDSSAALIPYTKKFKEQFILISTGTWCITLNPFNHNPLTQQELSMDCLCYMTPKGKPIKASRIFLGKEHEYQTDRIEKHFRKQKGYCNDIKFNPESIAALLEKNNNDNKLIPACMEGTGPFQSKQSDEWNLGQFTSCEDAYLQLMLDLTSMLSYSIQLVDNDTETIFVEGGFGSNDVFMNLLANHFPLKKVKASFLKQATALGAALLVNESCKLQDWEFRSFQSINISPLLENYYSKNWKTIR